MSDRSPAVAAQGQAARFVPFDAQRHAGLGVSAAQGYRWCAARNAVPLTAGEFFRAALHYPIAYTSALDGGYLPVAVLGLRDEENLFVDHDGRWAAGHYLPAYVRRHPFTLADMPADMPGDATGEQVRRLICVDEDQLSAEAQPQLIDRNGQPTAAWEPIRQLLESFDQGWRQTQNLSRRLQELNLLVPFDALAIARQGARMQLRGLFRVDEARLAAISADDLRAMLDSGELRALYAHLLSLENFGRLLERMQVPEMARGH